MLTFSNFKFIKTIGVGSFGRVYLIELLNDGIVFPKYYAMKILGLDDLIRLRQLNHFENEIKVLIMCKKHPFIVDLMLNVKIDNFYVMILEYIPGGELFSWIRKLKKFSLENVRFYSAQILLALKFLHDRGYVYRDLKPENILLNKDGYIKLTDFGFSQKMDVSKTFCGTPEYMAPEQVNTEEHGREVDFWSFGIVMYEMYTGMPPFYSQETFEVYLKITNEDINFVNFDYDLQDLITRLTVKDRKLRFFEGGFDEIMRHPFFKDINWVDIYEKRINPPIKPMLKGECDTSYFINYSEKIDRIRHNANPNVYGRYHFKKKF